MRSMSTRSAVVAAAAAALALSPLARAAPSLQLAPDGAVVRAFLGATEDGRAVSDVVVVRDASGKWSLPSALPAPARGIPVARRHQTWLLERRDATEIPFYSLLPLDGEAGGVRIETVEGGQDVLATALDPWTLLLVELDVNGRILARVIGTHGAAIEMEMERQASWDPAWPDGARLLAAGTIGEDIVVLGMTRAGQVAIGTHGGSAPVAALADVGAGSLVAACVTATEPLVAAVQDGSLVVRTWDGAAWLASPAVALPAPVRPEAMAACAVGARRTKALVAMRAQGELWARELRDAAASWERVSCAAPVDTAIRPASGEKPLVVAARRQFRLRLAMWTLIVAGCVALAFLIARLASVGRGLR